MSASILVVEDEPLIAMDIESELTEAGFSVVGTVGTVQDALSAIDTLTIDAVVLDGNLFGESSAPVAEKLKQDKIPYVVVTGYSLGQVGHWIKEAPRISKPFDKADLIAELGKLLK